MAHDLPTVGHLGVERTLHRIRILKSLTKEEKQEALSSLQGEGDQELATEPQPSAEEVSYVMTTRAQARKLQSSKESTERIQQREMDPS